MQETWVQSLGWEDPLEKRMATHSSILGWEIPLTEEYGGLQIKGSQKSGHNLSTKTITTIFKVFIRFVTTLLLLCVLTFWPRGMWDLSSLNRDRAWTSWSGSWSLNHWTTREVPVHLFLTPRCCLLQCYRGSPKAEGILLMCHKASEWFYDGERFIRAQARMQQGWLTEGVSVCAAHIILGKMTKIPEQRPELVRLWSPPVGMMWEQLSKVRL